MAQASRQEKQQERAGVLVRFRVLHSVRVAGILGFSWDCKGKPHLQSKYCRYARSVSGLEPGI